MALPSGTIYLLKDIPLDNTYEHTLGFTSREEQLSYFMSKRVKTYEYTTYIRKHEVIRVPYLLDDIANVNYVMYKASTNSKWYYCFVTKKKYISDELTDIDVEIDVMQTYLFDYKVQPSFVERSHVNRWGADKSPIFSYTDEGLDYGSEYLVEKAYNIKSEDNVMWFLVLMSHSKEFHEAVTAPSSLNNVPSPYVTYLVPHWMGDARKTFTIGDYAVCNINEFMHFMGDSAIGSAVKEISFIPYLPLDITVDSNGVIVNGESGLTLKVDKLQAKDDWLSSITEIFTGEQDASTNIIRIDANNSSYSTFKTLVSFNRNKGLDVLTLEEWDDILANSKTTKFDERIESKLLTYPYRYNLLTNWKSQPLLIKNEFSPKTLDIKMAKSLSFNNPTRYWVEDYKQDTHGRGNCILENLSLELPIISDAFYEYQLANKNQNNANMINSVINVAKAGVGAEGVLYGSGPAVAGMAAIGVAQEIGSTIAKNADIKNLPDSVINTNDCSLAIADENIYLTFYRYKINDVDADRLASYWHMYGYKVNRSMDVSRLMKSRERFNYIKTIGINLTGSFDNEDLAQIKANFNKGITIWHYYDGFKPLDYSYMNMETTLI